MQTPVTSKDGESLGKVQDLVINPINGEIQSVMISKSFVVGEGPVLGLGEVIVPVPWQAINLFSQRQLVVHVDQHKVESAPGDDKAGSDDSGYAVHIFGFIHPAPTPDAGGSGDSGVQSGHGGGESEPTVPDKPTASPREL